MSTSRVFNPGIAKFSAQPWYWHRYPILVLVAILLVRVKLLTLILVSIFNTGISGVLSAHTLLVHAEYASSVSVPIPNTGISIGASPTNTLSFEGQTQASCILYCKCGTQTAVVASFLTLILAFWNDLPEDLKSESSCAALIGMWVMGFWAKWAGVFKLSYLHCLALPLPRSGKYLRTCIRYLYFTFLLLFPAFVHSYLSVSVNV